jgi:hypothetical protein
MDEFSSRSITKLFEDVSAALDDVQSIRTRTSKVMRLLETLHERGWKISAAEPVKPTLRDEPTLDLEDTP